MNAPATNPWLPLRRPRTAAAVRLFCFPPAGTGCQLFARWQDGLPASVEVCGIETPGRWTRLREPPFTAMSPLVEAAFAGLRDLLDGPFALFGYSIGAIIAFELARLIRRRLAVQPTHLLVAARRAPQLAPLAQAPVHSLDDAALVEALNRTYGGIPPAVQQSPELLAMAVPILRADLTVLETYHYQSEPPLACPITAIGGESDRSTTRADLDAWHAQTSAHFGVQMFAGGHFFIQTAQEQLLGLIGSLLNRAQSVS